MFGLFEKKIPLIELLNGATDIHNHLLPGIDDGAKNVEESLELVKIYKNMGITKFYATPHTMSDYYPNTPETIKQALSNLNDNLAKNNLTDIKITAASEYMIDPEFEDLIDNDQLLTFKDKHVLVEMSYLRPSENFDEIIYKLQLKGYSPILAHPERYIYFVEDKTIFNQMKTKGIKLQLNGLSLSNYYGEKVKKKAMSLLSEGLYDFIGLDTHKTKHLSVLENIKIAKKHENEIKRLISNNTSLF